MAELNSLKSAAPAVATSCSSQQPDDSSSFATYSHKAKNSLLKVKLTKNEWYLPLFNALPYLNLPIWLFSKNHLRVTSNVCLTFLQIRHSVIDQQHERGNKITGLRLIAYFFTKGELLQNVTLRNCVLH